MIRIYWLLKRTNFLLFSIYYINYDKALELAMLLNNKIVESSTKEKIVEIGGEGSGSANTETQIPFIDKI